MSALSTSAWQEPPRQAESVSEPWGSPSESQAGSSPHCWTKPTAWRLKPHDPQAIAALSRASSIRPLLAQLLINRQMTKPEQVRRFLSESLKDLHDPETMPGIARAADRIVEAIAQARPIVIYGDYDVDGVCGSSLLWACLKTAGHDQVETYIPDRIEEGYGLNIAALERLAQRDPQPVVVTVDCGISSVAEASRAGELGLDLIITDHHQFGSELPDAYAVVHPAIPGSSYPFSGLCGAGVAFKLAWEVSRRLNHGPRAAPRLQRFLLEAVSLVSLATVADQVPLCDENRLFVLHGLRGLNQAPTTGLQALIQVSQGPSNPRPRPITSTTIGYNLGPRINAAGRLKHAQSAVELLTTVDPHRARDLAQHLDQLNDQRRQIERSVVDQASERVRDQGGVSGRGAIVVGDPEWHPGVLGIVASRLAETFHRPTVVFQVGQELAVGSARSIQGFDVYQAMQVCRDLMVTCGGHHAAAGLRLRPTDLAEFTERFDAHCRATMTDDQRGRRLWIDAEVPLTMLDRSLVEALDRLEPHGMGNPAPVLLSVGVSLVAPPRPVGDQSHVQLRLLQDELTLGAIGFGLAERFAEVEVGANLAIVHRPRMNHWRGRSEVQLQIKDFAVIPDS